MPVDIFISYAREDIVHLRELECHLALMKRQGILSTWHAELVEAGQDWSKEVAQRLSSAQMVILLVSSGYFYSDTCYAQMERARQRAREGKASLFPVLVRPCVHQGSWLDRLSKLPDNEVPVTVWPDRDAAWANVAEGIRKAIVVLGRGSTVSPMTVYPSATLPPTSSGYAPESSVRPSRPSGPSSWAAPPVSVYAPVSSPASASSRYSAPGATAPPYVQAKSVRSPVGAGRRSWFWTGVALTMVSACSFVAWNTLRPQASEPDKPAVVPVTGVSVVKQASPLSLDWGPGSLACPTTEAQIIVGECQRLETLEWLGSELSTLQSKKVGCLPDLPEAFTLRSHDNEVTGVKNFYLSIYARSGTKPIGNVWIKGGKLNITDLTTRKKVVLAYDDTGSWSAGPDADHLKLVP